MAICTADCWAYFVVGLVGGGGGGNGVVATGADRTAVIVDAVAASGSVVEEEAYSFTGGGWAEVAFTAANLKKKL